MHEWTVHESLQVYLNIKRNYQKGTHCMYALKACLTLYQIQSSLLLINLYENANIFMYACLYINSPTSPSVMWFILHTVHYKFSVSINRAMSI